jgi:hypothetical protein
MSGGHQVYIDVIEVAPDGVLHTYWSTHCRHGNHEACSATLVLDVEPLPTSGPLGVTDQVRRSVRRKPAQCKTCAAPCVCSCHDDGPSDDAAARTVAEFEVGP